MNEVKNMGKITKVLQDETCELTEWTTKFKDTQKGIIFLKNYEFAKMYKTKSGEWKRSKSFVLKDFPRLISMMQMFCDSEKETIIQNNELKVAKT